MFLDKIDSLIPAAREVLCDQATERPYTGHYNTVMTQGTYLCRRCGLGLFRAHSQFGAGCGWPSFDEEIVDAVKQISDSDGIRVEIRCNRCDSHLGHVFVGEYLTPKNKRYCVNSLALDFVEDNQVRDTEEAIVAGGCFWGVEYYLKQIPGVLATEVGYCGGTIAYPTYEQVCEGNTGHYEAVRVLFDFTKTNYEAVVKRFFEIHDPTQSDGQGPDIGSQYQSAIFYFNPSQQALIYDLIQQLLSFASANNSVVTQVLPAQIFWPAEVYHQQYYAKHANVPYCHRFVKRFSS